jgi:hypothetical protein
MNKKDLINMYLDLINTWKGIGIGNKARFGTVVTDEMIAQLENRLNCLTQDLNL